MTTALNSTTTTPTQKRKVEVKERPITALDRNCLKTLLQATPEEITALKGNYYTVQILSLKDVEVDKANGASSNAVEKTGKDKMKAVKLK